MFVFIMNGCDDVQVLEVEHVIGWDIMNNQRVGKIARFKVPSVFIDLFW